VGLVPLKTILDAGRYFLRKQKRSTGVSDAELIRIAVKSMGLNELHPFIPEEKIIEYMIEEDAEKKLARGSLQHFMEETASESPAPGGGSVSAAMGSLGVALGTMVANLSAHKRGWEDRWEEFSDWADRGKILQEELMRLVDRDAVAFKCLIEAYRLPDNTGEEKAEREKAIRDATMNAIMIPFEVMKTAAGGMELVEAMVRIGNPNSVADAGVGMLAIRACVRSALLNIRFNSRGLEYRGYSEKIIEDARKIETGVEAKEKQILSEIEENL